MRAPLAALAILGASSLVLGSAVLASGGDEPALEDVATEPSEGPTVTLPSEQKETAKTDDVLDLYAIIAEQRGITVDEAIDMMEVQNRLTDFALEMRGQPGYVDFRILDDGRSGELLLDSDVTTERVAPELNKFPEIKVSRSALNSDERASVESALRPVTSKFLDPSIGDEEPPIVWNGFESTYELVVPPTARLDAIELRAEALTAAPILEAKRIEVDVIVADDDRVLARGGKQITGSSDEDVCTTGFGIHIRDNFYGYLTAAHCGSTSTYLEPNGNTPQANVGRRFGRFHDRMGISAGGASWMTQISSSGGEVDMDSTPRHLVTGADYCHFGQESGSAQCGTIYLRTYAYHGIPGGDGVTHSYIWYWVSDAYCEPGDSGGPVWSIGTIFLPSGLIQSSPSNGGDCGYTALDDNMNTVNWTLL